MAYERLDRLTVAQEHLQWAFWALSGGEPRVAECHLLQALFPPISSSKRPEYYLGPLREAAIDAYHDLLQKNYASAKDGLRQAVYPEGIPPHELIVRKYRS
jgi:hypothetical protein